MKTQVCQGCLKTFPVWKFRNLRSATRNGGKARYCELCAAVNRLEKLQKDVDRLRITATREEWKFRRDGQMAAAGDFR